MSLYLSESALVGRFAVATATLLNASTEGSSPSRRPTHDLRKGSPEPCSQDCDSPLETELSWPPLQPQEFESMYGVNAELFDMADEMLRPQRSEV